MVDTTKTTAHTIGHMAYIQAPTGCEKNIFYLFHSASEKLLILFSIVSVVSIVCLSFCLYLNSVNKDCCVACEYIKQYQSEET